MALWGTGDAGWLRPDLVWAGNYVWLEHNSFVDLCCFKNDLIPNFGSFDCCCLGFPMAVSQPHVYVPLLP